MLVQRDPIKLVTLLLRLLLKLVMYYIKKSLYYIKTLSDTLILASVIDTIINLFLKVIRLV